MARARNRKLSLKAKIINLNMVALAKFWYLSTVFPIPDWELQSTERLIFKYLWDIPDDELGNEPVARNTIYLPKERGGLALLHPVHQSTALRFKFFAKIVDPECTAKWVFLARYWLGNPLGLLDPTWAFLRGNHLPRPDRPRYPEYYVDCLHLLQNTPDLIKKAWDTAVIRKHILAQDPTKPNAHDEWPRLGLTITDAQWKKAWSGIYSTMATGFQQDTHYLFMHVALYTNLFTSKFGKTSRFCSYCSHEKGNNCEENIFHLFFECSVAKKVWNKVTPLLKLIMNTNNIRRTSILFNDFPDGTPNHIKNLTLTTSQIILQRIWLNRNEYLHQNKPPDIDGSKTKIFDSVMNMVVAQYNIYKGRKQLQKFQKRFCIYNGEFCFLDATRKPKFPYLNTL